VYDKGEWVWCGPISDDGVANEKSEALDDMNGIQRQEKQKTHDDWVNHPLPFPGRVAGITIALGRAYGGGGEALLTLLFLLLRRAGPMLPALALSLADGGRERDLDLEARGW
jgi:hypothetical protein